jgi:hypothetical protein
MATNITNYPGTGYTTTFVQRITKSAVQSIATDPLLLRFLMNDGSFNSQLTQSFDRGDIANITVAPTLTATRSTNANDTVSYQTAAFTSVQVTLDNFSLVPFKYRDIEMVMSDTDIRANLEDSAGKALVRDMYSNIVSKFANDTLISSDQRIGTLNTPMNYNALRRLRTTAEKQFLVPRDARITVLLNPDAYEALTGDSTFQNQISGNTDTIVTGIVSNALNLEVYSDPTLGNNGGNSQSISGSAGYIGLAFVDQSGVLITRQIPLTDPTRQFRASYQGVSALYTRTPDSQYVGGMMVQDKLEVLYGFKAMPAVRWSDGATRTKIWPILGGL